MILLNRFALLLLVLSGLFQTGCASLQQTAWLADHRAALKRLADSNLTGEQKIDGLINDYIQFMNEGLQFADPRKGIKFVKLYHDQNKASIEKILNDSQNWQSKLNTADRVQLGIRFAQKPYLKSATDLFPKFKRKYQQYATIVELTSKVSGGLVKFAGNIFN